MMTFSLITLVLIIRFFVIRRRWRSQMAVCFAQTMSFASEEYRAMAVKKYCSNQACLRKTFSIHF